ncbi:MAG TPA: hypothetical protein VLW17_06975 [Thermoanaerobaculaceae bacterium]|nr:hypothetical protein [Thermoanaerobaculaceae bacterium]
MVGKTTLAWILLAVATTSVAAQIEPAPTPARAAQASPAVAPETRTIKLDLDQLIDIDAAFGHAEFNPSARREMWKDPMVRLEYGLAREQWAAQWGGMPNSWPPATIGASILLRPPAGPRLIFPVSWASDWEQLTPQEKIGRLTEDALYAGIYAGIIAGILRALR